MSSSWLGHHHGHHHSPIHRLPAALKLGVALALIVATVLAPPNWTAWYAGTFVLLIFVTSLSRLPPLFLLKRLLVLSPFIIGVALASAFQTPHRGHVIALAAKSILCLLTVILVSNTTPFSQILRVLKWVRVPSLLITTIALMHRYLFVLVDEADRMRRARLSRTFTGGRRVRWRAFATVIGQLFVRASERAERIYGAMCARGWR